eukprot:1524160-Alexandrium_andersonii.AAC.1
MLRRCLYDATAANVREMTARVATICESSSWLCVGGGGAERRRERIESEIARCRRVLEEWRPRGEETEGT